MPPGRDPATAADPPTRLIDSDLLVPDRPVDGSDRTEADPDTESPLVDPAVPDTAESAKAEAPDDDLADSDEDHPDDAVPDRDGPLLTRLRARRPSPRAAALLAGILVGALVSGFGVYNWQHTRAEESRQDSVVMGARVARIEVDGAGAWPLGLTIENFGARPVRIDNARLVGGNRFDSSLRPVSRGISVSPGEQVPLSLTVSLQCDGRRSRDATAPTEVEMTVAPEGRAARTVRLRLSDDDGGLADAARLGCLTGTTNLEVSASLSDRAPPARSGRSLTTPVTLLFSSMSATATDQRAPTGGQFTVRAAVPGLKVDVTPSPFPVPTLSGFWTDQGRQTRYVPLTAEAVLRWSITDCPGLAGLRAGTWAMIEMPASSRTATLATALRLGDDLLLVVSRFLGDACGA